MIETIKVIAEHQDGGAWVFTYQGVAPDGALSPHTATISLDLSQVIDEGPEDLAGLIDALPAALMETVGAIAAHRNGEPLPPSMTLTAAP